jgi:hypothetical protein
VGLERAPDRADNIMMGSGTAARVLLVIGFLAAWIGYDAWIFSHVVLDPSTTRSAAHALLESATVRSSLADTVTAQIDRQLPAATNDPRVGPAVAEAIRDPRVEAAFADTIAQIHQAVLADANTTTFRIDGRALTNALHDEIAPKDPQLAAQILQAPPLHVNISAGGLPHTHDARPTADVVFALATIAALLFVTASLLLRHDRRAVAQVGRRVAYLAVMPLVVFVALPRVLTHASGEAPQIVAALLRVYGDRVLPSAIALLVVGGAVAIAALLWPRNVTEFGRSGPPPRSPFNGPTPTPRPPGPADRPEITDRLYL